MTTRLREQLDPIFRRLPGRKLHAVARELATLCRDDGTLTYGKALHATLAERAGCSVKTVQRLPKALPPGLLEYVPGLGHAASGWRFNLAVAASLLAGITATQMASTQTGRGSGQHDVILGSSPRRWGGTAPRGPAGWWDRRRMDQLVTEVQKLRPAWTAGGIVAAAVRALRNGATMERLRRALLAVARAGDSAFPMRVVSNGWWWDQGSERWHADPAAGPQEQDAPDKRHTRPPAYRRDVVEQVAARSLQRSLRIGDGQERRPRRAVNYSARRSVTERDNPDVKGGNSVAAQEVSLTDSPTAREAVARFRAERAARRARLAVGR